MTHIIKDYVLYPVLCLLFIFILSNQVLPAIKLYSFQPTALAIAFPENPCPRASFLGTESLKRHTLKVKPGKNRYVRAEGVWCSLNEKGQRKIWKKPGPDSLTSNSHKWQKQEQPTCTGNHSRTNSQWGWREPSYIPLMNQSICLQCLPQF